MKGSNYVSKLLTFCVIVAFAVPQMVSASQFEGNPQGVTITVTYADLNLASEAGVTALYRRLHGAAQSVCGEQHALKDAGSLERLLKNKQCYSATLDSAVAKFDNPKLQRIHGG